MYITQSIASKGREKLMNELSTMISRDEDELENDDEELDDEEMTDEDEEEEDSEEEM